jgi:hypothetical protein
MVTYRLLGWVTILALGLLLPSRAVFAQVGDALVRPDSIVLEVGKGQVETLQILLVNAKNIYGIDLQAAFDPEAVEIVDVDSQQDGVQMTPGLFLKPDFVVRNEADNKAGTLRYVVTQLNPSPPVNGDGVIVSVQFLGKVTGIRSKLHIVSVQIADRHGIKQPVTVQDAELVAVPPKPSTPTPFLTSTPELATPTPVRATLTRSVSQATARPIEPAEQEEMTNVASGGAAFADRAITYVTVGGFSGSFLLFGLSFWLLAAKRNKRRMQKPK